MRQLRVRLIFTNVTVAAWCLVLLAREVEALPAVGLVCALVLIVSDLIDLADSAATTEEQS